VRIGEEIYASLLNLGVEALLDDRDARPGVKFADAELIGIPYRVTVGPKGIADGVVEFVPRNSGEATLVPIEETPAHIAEIIESAK
jgi:prolyl-tRNA synthetase